MDLGCEGGEMACCKEAMSAVMLSYSSISTEYGDCPPLFLFSSVPSSILFSLLSVILYSGVGMLCSILPAM